MKLKRFFGLLLLVSLFISSLPCAVFAVDRENTDNIAQKDYADDVMKWSTDYNSNGFSSGARDYRWNKFVNKTTADSIADPANPENKVGRFFGTGSSIQRYFLYGEEGKDFILSSKFYIPACTDGQGYPLKVTFKLSNQAVLTLIYDAQSGLYRWQCSQESGYVAPETWINVSMHVSPSVTQGFAQSRLAVQLSGSLKDNAGNALSYAKAVIDAFAYDNTTDNGASFFVEWTVPTDAGGAKIPGGIYLDNTRFYICGEFRITDVLTDKYADVAKNVNLNGAVTVVFNHTLDLSTLDLSKVRLFTDTESNVPYTEIRFDPIVPNKLTFSFAQDALTTYTDYYIAFEDTVADLGGSVLYNPLVSFTTQGTENSRPAPEPIIKEPAGGYVMPDEYNTGYRCDESELVAFGEKYPLASGGNITEDVARAYNYEFSGFTLNGGIKVTATSPVYVHDFFLNATSHYGVQNNGSARLTVAWAECTGSSSAMFIGANMTVSHVYCYDVKADHMKGASNQVIESCYFRDGGTRNPGAHADVLQISCSTTAITNSIKVLGNRFDIPAMAFDHVANACIFIKPEKSGSTLSEGHANIQISYNWFNGGGYTTYLVTNDVPVEKLNYLTYSYNTLGCGRRFNYLNHGGWSTDDFNYVGNEEASLLEAGSVVFYDENGKRIFDAASMTESGEVFINFANYTLLKRNYNVVVDVVDENGEVVKTFTKADTVKENMWARAYDKPENQEQIEFTQADGTTITVTVYKEGVLDFPRAVPCSIPVADLPDMNGCTLQVKIYDTTAEETLIRSSLLSDKVYENTLMPGYVHEDHVYDGDCDVDCNECGEVRAAGAHTFTDKYVYNNDATHTADGTKTIACDVCNRKGNATVVAEGTRLTDAHTFEGEWKCDNANHWKECVCGEKGSATAHTDSDNNGYCDICNYVPSGFVEKQAFENAVAAFASLKNASLAAKYNALYTAALAFAQVEDQQTMMQGQAYQTYVAFAESYNEAARAISGDIVRR